MEIAFVFSGEIRFLKDNKDYLLDLKNKYNAVMYLLAFGNLIILKIVNYL